MQRRAGRCRARRRWRPPPRCWPSGTRSPRPGRLASPHWTATPRWARPGIWPRRGSGSARTGCASPPGGSTGGPAAEAVVGGDGHAGLLLSLGRGFGGAPRDLGPARLAHDGATHRRAQDDTSCDWSTRPTSSSERRNRQPRPKRGGLSPRWTISRSVAGATRKIRSSRAVREGFRVPLSHRHDQHGAVAPRSAWASEEVADGRDAALDRALLEVAEAEDELRGPG